LRLNKAISLAFLVALAGAAIRFGGRTVSALGAPTDFAVLVMMFSIVISRDQLSPGTDKSPERRAEKMGRPLKARRYGQYRSVQLVSRVGNGRIIGKNSCATCHEGGVRTFAAVCVEVCYAN